MNGRNATAPTSAIPETLAATALYITMIKKEHIKTFAAFNGDIDGWARMNKSDDSMTDDIWLEIEGILQDLRLINTGAGS